MMRPLHGIGADEERTTTSAAGQGAHGPQPPDLSHAEFMAAEGVLRGQTVVECLLLATGNRMSEVA